MTPTVTGLALLEKAIAEKIAMKDLKPSKGRAIVLDSKGKPMAKPSRMSVSQRIAKKKAAGKPKLTRRIKGAQKPA